MKSFKHYVMGGIVATGLLMPTGVDAEDKWQGTATFEGLNIDVNGGTPSFGFELGAWRRVHDNVQLGFGVGMTERWDFKGNPSFPLYVGLHAEDFEKSFTPMFDFRLGYSFNTNGMDYSTFFINPMLGVRFNRFGLAVGYLGGKANMENSSWSSAINLRFTYYFGYHSTKTSNAIKNELSKLNVGAEWTADISTGPDKYGTKGTSGFGLNVSLLYPVTDKFEVGPMVGFHYVSMAQKVYWAGVTGGEWDNNYGDLWLPLALRAKYSLRQISVAGRFYPWVQMDLGGSISTGVDLKSGFYWSPAVGLSYDVRGGRSSIDLGVGYHNLKMSKDIYMDNPGTFSSGVLRISLGYTF